MYTQYDDDGNIQMVEEPSPDYIYTYADYLKWKWEERVELFKGVIMKMAAPGTRHQSIIGNIFLPIALFLKNKPCRVFLSPFDVRLPIHNKLKDEEVITVMQPDLCVVCDDSKIDKRGCIGAPDIMIEVLSPGNSKKEMQSKLELYEEAGVREYGVRVPVEEIIIIYSLENDRYHNRNIYSSGQTITTSVLPGLEINTTDIFKQ